MLYLTRKVGQSVMINDTIEVSVVEVRGKSIKLGFTFPKDVAVLRREIYDKVQEENRAASDSNLELIAPAKGAPE
jgi:carbon storage regulator